MKDEGPGTADRGPQAGGRREGLVDGGGPGVGEIVPEGVELTRGDLAIEEDESVVRRLGLAGLEGEVMDSTSYSQKVSPGAVLDQYPRPGTAVKGGRVIKLTLNRSRPALVLVPGVLDKSLARATYDLTSKGFSVGTVTRQPDVSTDVVLAVQSRGKTLAADTKLPFGSVVDLVVSGGVGAGEFSMPDLLGLSLDQLELFLAEINLVTGVVDLPNQDTTGARVYRQDPAAGASVRAGESVDLWLEKK